MLMMKRQGRNMAVRRRAVEQDVYGIPRSRGPKTVWGQIQDVISLYETIKRLYDNITLMWRNRLAYTVTLSEGDYLYDPVHSWLMENLPEEKNRFLSVKSKSMSTSRSFDSDEDRSEARELKPDPIIIQFNDTHPRKVQVGGHTVTVELSRPDAVESATSRSSEPTRSKIVFVARTLPAQKAVLDLLEGFNANRARSRKAVLKMVGHWGNWSTRSDLPPRTMDSVILPAEQKNRIINDLQDFLDSEKKYARLALPWHRGYMFHGPPGTGKTSLVKAMANHFNLDLWYISLSDMKEESSLLNLIAEVGPRSLLLLEDIDTVRITHDRDAADQGKISMSSLLNTLDGVATPHGLITVMTTNRFEILDTALTRAGRMDVVEMLDYPTPNSVAEMFRYFYGESPRWEQMSEPDMPIKGLSTSRIAELMKRHMDDPESASVAVWKEMVDTDKASV